LRLTKFITKTDRRQSGPYLWPHLADLARGEKVHVLKQLFVYTVVRINAWTQI